MSVCVCVFYMCMYTWIQTHVEPWGQHPLSSSVVLFLSFWSMVIPWNSSSTSSSTRLCPGNLWVLPFLPPSAGTALMCCCSWASVGDLSPAPRACTVSTSVCQMLLGNILTSLQPVSHSDSIVGVYVLFREFSEDAESQDVSQNLLYSSYYLAVLCPDRGTKRSSPYK